MLNDIPKTSCDMCGDELTEIEQGYASGLCSQCLNEQVLERARLRSSLSRHERLQRLADSGCDTWEEYNEDR